MTGAMYQTIMEGLNRQRQAGNFVDITLVIDDMAIPMHRLMLAATSGFFSRMMETNHSEVVHVSGIPVNIMLTVLDFIYTGVISLDEESLPEYQKLGNLLEIKVLEDYCIRKAKEFGGVDNFGNTDITEQQTKAEHVQKNTCDVQTQTHPVHLKPVPFVLKRSSKFDPAENIPLIKVLSINTGNAQERSGVLLDQQATENAESTGSDCSDDEEALMEVNKEALIDVNKETLTDINKEALIDIKKNALTDVNKDPLTDVNKEALTNVNKETLTDVNKEALTDVNKEALTDVNKDPLTDVNKDPLTDVNKDPLTDVNKDPLTDVNKDPLTDVNKDPLTDVNKEALTDVNKDPLTDVNKEALTDVNKDPLTDVNKEALTDFSDLERQVKCTEVKGECTIDRESGANDTSKIHQVKKNIGEMLKDGFVILGQGEDSGTNSDDVREACGAQRQELTERNTPRRSNRHSKQSQPNTEWEVQQGSSGHQTRSQKQLKFSLKEEVNQSEGDLPGHSRHNTRSKSQAKQNQAAKEKVVVALPETKKGGPLVKRRSLRQLKETNLDKEETEIDHTHDTDKSVQRRKGKRHLKQTEIEVNGSEKEEQTHDAETRNLNKRRKKGSRLKYIEEEDDAILREETDGLKRDSKGNSKEPEVNEMKDEMNENSEMNEEPEENEEMNEDRKPKRHKSSIPEQPVSCDICGQSYCRMAGLRKHMDEKHPKDILKCELCSRRFFFKNLYEQHTKRCRIECSGRETGVYSCFECDHSGKDLKQVWKHYRINHTDEQKHVCPHCSIAYNGNSQFYEHLVRDHNVDIKQINAKIPVHRCDQCDFVTTRYINWSYHRNTHAQRQKCHICEKTFVGKAQLSAHISNIHNKSTMFECELCGHRSPYKETLLAHLYRSHKILAQNKSVYQCPFCDFSHIGVQYINRHIKSNHVHSKQFHCQYCVRRFRLKVQLITHERQHTGEAPYSCSECGHRAKSRQSLVAHHESKHSVGPKYMCDMCGRAFKIRQNYDSHKKICKETLAKISILETGMSNIHESSSDGMKRGITESGGLTLTIKDESAPGITTVVKSSGSMTTTMDESTHSMETIDESAVAMTTTTIDGSVDSMATTIDESAVAMSTTTINESEAGMTTTIVEATNAKLAAGVELGTQSVYVVDGVETTGTLCATTDEHGNHQVQVIYLQQAEPAQPQ